MHLNYGTMTLSIASEDDTKSFSEHDAYEKEALMSRTIKDVAKLAGVSISTVSRVMNDSKPVSPESRKRYSMPSKNLTSNRMNSRAVWL